MAHKAPKIARGIALALLVTGLLTGAAACGGRQGDYGGAHPDYERVLAGAPRPLAALYADANELLPGGRAAFERRIGALRGYPVVVNKWASWCGPCREEFPFFQRLSAKLGKRVAFLGVDSDDSDDRARTFLEEYPVPYPSFSDPEQEVAKAFKATVGFPSTGFYDRRGKLVATHVGVYRDEAQLAADIARYAK
jgi:thiol-disulfide isomerase/thioredoxin